MPESPPATDLARFEIGDIDPATFDHREHLRMAFEMLRLHPFSEAVHRFARAIRLLAAQAGKPHRYHETVTMAFLALVGEHLAHHPCADFATFAAANPALLDKTILRRWYSPDRLDSPTARATFILPLPTLA